MALWASGSYQIPSSISGSRGDDGLEVEVVDNDVLPDVLEPVLDEACEAGVVDFSAEFGFDIQASSLW